jgi:cold shock protein
MVSGVVKFFSKDKGYGFIRVEGFNDDAFVHITVLQKANINHLEEGQKVVCEVDYIKKGNKLRVSSLKLTEEGSN